MLKNIIKVSYENEIIDIKLDGDIVTAMELIPDFEFFHKEFCYNDITKIGVRDIYFSFDRILNEKYS